MADYLELFISELEQYLKQMNKQLLKLESNRQDMDSIVEVFRIFHTIKGMAQTMGYASLADVSHKIEDLLGETKEKGEIGQNLVDFLFIVTDLFVKSANALRNKEALPSADEILEMISRIKEGEEMAGVKYEVEADRITEIRIKMDKLDTLFNLTNELMITKSRISKLSEAIGDKNLLNLSDTSSHLISSLQDEVMRLRMLPLSTVFEFFPRWFRDEAKRMKKDVDLKIKGGDIEVDRSIIDVLKEPLLHLIRNSLDHGIERSTGEGKKKGHILLRAVREKDRIKISVSDNGKGIDIAEIRRKAIENGLVTETAAQHLTQDEVFRLLTRPDFSTREEVTDISGRGIGLNIVSSVVDRFGGKLIIASEKDEGSSFTLELPLSLAIVRAMIFKLDGQRFALPLSFVKETFYINENMLKTIYHRELYPLRNEILPLARLSDRLGCVGKKGRKSVIVVQTQDKKRGFIVDEIVSEEEIVVKQLDPLLTTPLYSGCSIYADGLPILILDPRGFE